MQHPSTSDLTIYKVAIIVLYWYASWMSNISMFRSGSLKLLYEQTRVTNQVTLHMKVAAATALITLDTMEMKEWIAHSLHGSSAANSPSLSLLHGVKLTKETSNGRAINNRRDYCAQVPLLLLLLLYVGGVSDAVVGRKTNLPVRVNDLSKLVKYCAWDEC